MQRIAIARAIVNKPRILLLDEPLAALDLKVREKMRYELKEMQRNLGITFIFVTHDQEEAMSISDEIVVMRDGVIQQIGKPQDVYDAPANLFVAKFLGNPQINVFEGFNIKNTILRANSVTAFEDINSRQIYDLDFLKPGVFFKQRPVKENNDKQKKITL